MESNSFEVIDQWSYVVNGRRLICVHHCIKYIEQNGIFICFIVSGITLTATSRFTHLAEGQCTGHCVGIVNTGGLGLLAWFVSVVMKSIRVKTRLDIMSEFSIQNQ